MAIVQALLAALARQTGKLLNTVFGWATITLFGKVPQNKQTYLSVIALGSVIWIVLLVGVIFPEAGVFLLSFVTLPEWVQEGWVRLGMLAAALLLPAIIGLVATRLNDAEDRPRGARAIFRRILNGYPYTVATALAVILMALFAPVLKLRTVAKRWSTEHLPMIVEDQDYMQVVQDVEKALDNAGYPVTRTSAGFMLQLPVKVLKFFAGKGRSSLVGDELAKLVSDKVELILHPSDLVISGSKYDAARVRAIVAEQLAFSPAYQTWSKEANELEDRLGELWKQAKASGGVRDRAAQIEELQQVERALRDAKIQHEEWEVLFREKLLVERGFLQMAAGITGRPNEPADADARRIGSDLLPATPLAMARKYLPQALLVAGATLSAVILRPRRQADRITCEE